MDNHLIDGNSGSFGRIGITIFLMLNRCFIIFKLSLYIEDFADFLDDRGFIKNIGMQRSWKLFFAMAIAGLWCCCGFFMVGKIEAMNRRVCEVGGTSYSLTWPEVLGLFKVLDFHDDLSSSGTNDVNTLQKLTSIAVAFIQSLYWAYITMVSFLLL